LRAHREPWELDAQVKSSVVYGLTAALRGAITIDRGRVQQKNFNDYQVLRIHEMPVVDVHIIPSEEAPTGAGDSRCRRLPRRYAMRYSRATGKRVRRLPIRRKNLV